MDYSDLLERMMHRDTDAFLEMTDRYGWTLYNAIRRKYPDKMEADRIYNETMQQFYCSLQNPNCEDPLEALLCAWAEYVSGKKGFLSEMLGDGAMEEPPAIQARRLKDPFMELPEKRRPKFRSFIGVMIVVAVMCACCWIFIGFLMERGVIPFYDFGYSWFCSQVENWLSSWHIV